jgi:hypothetical protein
VPITDAVPALFYPWGGGNEWYYNRYLDGVEWRPCNRNFGGVFVDLGGKRAFIALASVAVVNQSAYPYTDPDAGAEFGEEFRYWNNPATPDPARHPTHWYGHKRCDPAHAPQLEPQYGDTTAPPDKVVMPTDCKLGGQPGICPSSKGNQCPWMVAVLFYYDVEDIAAAYRGEVEPYEVQPYAIRSMRDVISGSCGYASAMQYDYDNDLLLVAVTGQHPKIKMIRLDGGEPPDPCGDGYCDPATEDWTICPEDCEEPDPCGDGECVPPEDHGICPADCPDVTCDVASGDDCATDPVNCGACPECPPSTPVMVVDQAGAQIRCEVE